ncbi:MAG: DUF6056 family protein, partial [Lachnospiraceae bacterium]|nr:DUF6056 family protein [Lachnospiraceae bacterium]
DLEGYIARFKDILVITKRDLGVLFIIFTVVAVAYIALEKYRETDEVSYIPFFMLLAGCASIVVLTFAFSYPERAFFAGTILVISAISYLYNDVICSVGIAAGLIVTIALLSVTFFSFEKEIPAVKKTYAQYNEGYELIQSAIKRGDKEVEIPIVYPSESRYDAFFGLNYIQESPDDWVNSWLGLYYGLRIKGIPAENNGAQ